MSKPNRVQFSFSEFLGGLFFCGIASFMLFGVISSSRQDLAVRRDWTPTPCTVLASSVNNGSNGKYLLTVRYRYEADGKTRESNRCGRCADVHTFEKIEEKPALLARFAPGTVHEGRVNPDDPADVVLVPPEDPIPMTLGVSAFLSIFLFIGLFLMFRPWLPRRRKHRHQSVGGSVKTKGSTSRYDWLYLIPIFMGAAFLAAGGFVLHIFVSEIFADRAACSWPTVEATLLRSEVKSTWHSGQRGGGHYSYSPYVAYSYEVDGRRFEGDRYAFLNHSSGKSSVARERLAPYPVGSRVQVHVDPDDPSKSVLAPEESRSEVGAPRVLAIGFPSIFVLVGLFLFLLGLVGFVRSGSRPAVNLSAPPPPGGVRLRDNRGGDVVGYVIFAVLWNMLSWGAAAAFRASGDMVWPPSFISGTWIPWIVIPVFLLTGVGLVVRAVWGILRLRTARLRIVTPRGFLPRGVPTDLAYRLSDGVEDLKELRISLVGATSVVEGSGKGARSVASEFYRSELLRAVTPYEIRQGTFRAEPPADAPATDRRMSGVRWHFETELHRTGRKPRVDKFSVTVV